MCDVEGLKNFERPNYIEGQILRVKDLEDEQNYHLGKNRLHNRKLHGWGIVCGLSLSIKKGDAISIQPGVALDCEGNEIVVPEVVEIPLQDFSSSSFVVVQYKESKCALVSVPTNSLSQEADITKPSRIREGYELSVRPDNPCKDHLQTNWLRRTCGKPHPIPIGVLSLRRRGWSVKSYQTMRGCRIINLIRQFLGAEVQLQEGM